MKNEKGITIITLVITIVIMLILVGIVTHSGMQSVETAKKTAFISEMEMIQAKVNIIYEERKQNSENLEYYNNLGQDISTIDNSKVTIALGSSDKTGFRYFTKSDLKQIDLDNISQEVLINYDTREVVSLNGFEIDGVTYYKLKDIPNYVGYNVDYVNKNTEAPTFAVEQTKLEDDSYKFTVKDIVYSGNVQGGTVSYKLHSDTNWILNGDNLSFTLASPGLYDVRFTDKAGNSTTVQKWIYVEDGLKLYLDGEYNTRTGHNPNSTVWEDLSENKNDAIGYNMATSNGYYSEEENGYVFLENASYFKTKDNIGISGDDNYTVESVMKFKPNGPYSDRCPIWFGNGASGWYVGGTAVPSYSGNKKFSICVINNHIQTDTTYENVYEKNIAVSWSKIKKGEILLKDKEYNKIFVDGVKEATTYNGTAIYTANLVDSPAEIGRFWPWNNQNRTLYGAVKMIRVYNRPLTDEEIKINYEIDKFRFDITE